ncbi:acetyltransferase [Massilia sp. H6]|uniref:PglD-related sugar-binding protein n=1 Tax=Massilia sp. H6 TaxID=2970464 RepID=UPI002168CFE1|nr:acetyltransferase [Massilia sp. H6]UVW27863.1 acetyltransferase [Massilia sp. H6]
MDLKMEEVPGMKNALIISAGGFGRTVYNMMQHDVANGVDWRVVGFLDNRAGLAAGAPLPLLGDPLTYRCRPYEEFLCALGDPAQRRRFAAPLLAQGAAFMSLLTGLHKAIGLTMGVGCLFEPEVRVGVDTHLGDFVFIMSTAVIGYEVEIGSYATIGSFAFVGGRARIGSDVVIHPHATILPGVAVGDGAVIGAGAVVMADVPPGVTMIGNPAKVFRFK